ncbi:hypothetical protein TI39_contig5827g00022 [Zymoseptoria brevis]|uniref:Large ribosomal subunit protein mL53 n=1 Tax=Zymoseptoria brevis TaxID=1047168 RepID=A0A0F4G954_9PEZI|nr:hypothetical protein TI39_contig5827g00022 [Zymoseptoria brevis]
MSLKRDCPCLMQSARFTKHSAQGIERSHIRCGRRSRASECMTTSSSIAHRPTETSAADRSFLVVKMLTKYLTSVTTSFSPFNPRSGKTARNFLALLPPNARSTMAISITMLPKAQAATPASLAIKFKDGKEMQLDLEKLRIKDIETEVDRHSRSLRRAEDLAGN